MFHVMTLTNRGERSGRGKKSYPTVTQHSSIER